jgi:hypothetical protein
MDCEEREVAGFSGDLPSVVSRWRRPKGDLVARPEAIDIARSNQAMMLEGVPAPVAKKSTGNREPPARFMLQRRGARGSAFASKVEIDAAPRSQLQ